MDYTLLSFSGRLTDDPQIRVSEGGMSICKFTVACNKRLRDGEEKTSYIPTTVFGRDAEVCHEFLTKGREVRVNGELETDSYVDKEGIKRKGFGCIADKVDFGGGKKKETDDAVPVKRAVPARSPSVRGKIFSGKYPASRKRQ